MPYIQPSLQEIENCFGLRETIFEIFLNSISPILPNFIRKIWLDICCRRSKIKQERWLNNAHLDNLQLAMRVDRPRHAEPTNHLRLRFRQAAIRQIFIPEGVRRRMYFYGRTPRTLEHHALFPVATTIHHLGTAVAKIVLGNLLGIRMSQTHEHIRTHSRALLCRHLSMDEL